MNKITLQQTLPEVFAGRNEVCSEVWHQTVEWQKGEIYLVEAQSGTGKSSLCSYIYGYRNDYQGIIGFDGKNIQRLDVKQWVDLRRSSLSMMFQDLRLFTELTVWENLQLKNQLTHHLSKKQMEGWLEQLGIAEKRDVMVSRISFGQQQRVALLRALCQPFDFIFLDEPVSHLDKENAMIMAEILMLEVERQGAGVVVTSIGSRLDLPYTKTYRL